MASIKIPNPHLLHYRQWGFISSDTMTLSIFLGIDPISKAENNGKGHLLHLRERIFFFKKKNNQKSKVNIKRIDIWALSDGARPPLLLDGRTPTAKHIQDSYAGPTHPISDWIPAGDLERTKIDVKRCFCFPFFFRLLFCQQVFAASLIISFTRPFSLASFHYSVAAEEYWREVTPVRFVILHSPCIPCIPDNSLAIVFHKGTAVLPSISRTHFAASPFQ
jgi:hypothetical protein